MDNKKEIAFNDFKGAITIGEFEAVLSLVEDEYNNFNEAIENISKAREKFKSNLDQNGEGLTNVQKMVIDGLDRFAKERAKSMFGDKLDRLNNLIEFANRFKVPGKELKKIDLNF